MLKKLNRDQIGSASEATCVVHSSLPVLSKASNISHTEPPSVQCGYYRNLIFEVNLFFACPGSLSSWVMIQRTC